MLANSIRSTPSGNSSIPVGSMFPNSDSTSPTSTMIPINSSPIPFTNNNDFIHAPMQSIFSSDSGRKSPVVIKSPIAVTSPPVGRSMTISPAPMSTVNSDMADSIPIPVKVISSSSSSASPSSSQGLKSPSVLQNVSHRNPFQFPSVKPTGSSGGATQPHEPMSNLFDQFGSVKDPDENMMAMRRRFEEAKQRMALSLPAREGGLRPNSLIARSLFDSDKFQSAWGDGTGGGGDASSFLLEQLRRRNKRRMDSLGGAPPAPHPELTPQQRQHIFERSSTAAAAGGIGGALQAGVPLRRMLPGGSVAERVLMFEKSPSIFGFDAGTAGGTAGTGNIVGGSSGGRMLASQRREPISAIAGSNAPSALTPWRSQSHELQGKQAVKKERIVPISRLEAAPLVKPVAGQPSLAGRANTPLLSAGQAGPPPVTRPKKPAGTSTTFRPPSLHLPGKEEIPKFYFPSGNPVGKTGPEALIKKFTEAFSKHKNGVTLEQLGQVLKTCGLPLYWKSCVWQSCGLPGEPSPSSGDTLLPLATLTKTWRKLMQRCHDEYSQFMALVTGGTRTTLAPEDLVPLVQDIVDTHPGLLFLKEATEFHSRYVHTVIARIFYVVNRSWSGKISLSELRRSTLLATLRTLEQEDDINQITDFFSYEHFYVIYCKFWELDKDHDLFIDREDLARHNDHALSTRMIERIFCGAVTRGSAQREGRMSYTEFVWFLLSEEDKRHPTAIEYWFRCMDLDGDGVLSMYELEYFYEEQLQRMEQLGIETLPFDDCLCQMLDMIRPETANKITLRDLKRCKMTPIFFDTFFNLEKYLDHEQRDPFATQRETDEDGNEMSDWDRFAAEEYELLVAEEGSNENMEDMAYEEGQAMDQLEAPEDSIEREMMRNSQQN